MFSTKKLWKVTILWLGMKNKFWFVKRRLHVIANLHYIVLFLFQIYLLILLPNSCIVASRVGLVFSLGTPIETPTAEDWAYVKRCSLRMCFLNQNYFLFHCIYLIKWSRGGEMLILLSQRTDMYIKTISWNIEIHSELLLSYKSLDTSTDV